MDISFLAQSRTNLTQVICLQKFPYMVLNFWCTESGTLNLQYGLNTQHTDNTL